MFNSFNSTHTIKKVQGQKPTSEKYHAKRQFLWLLTVLCYVFLNHQYYCVGQLSGRIGECKMA